MTYYIQQKVARIIPYKEGMEDGWIYKNSNGSFKIYKTKKEIFKAYDWLKNIRDSNIISIDNYVVPFIYCHEDERNFDKFLREYRDIYDDMYKNNTFLSYPYAWHNKNCKWVIFDNLKSYRTFHTDDILKNWTKVEG